MVFAMNDSKMTWIALLTAMTMVAACGGEAEDKKNTNNQSCVGKCDSNEGDALLKSLETRNDPIAQYLKAHPEVAKQGLIEGNFETMISGINEQMGCAPEEVKHFFVSDPLITGSEPFPRNVSVVCSGGRNASKVFFSMPDGFEDLSDLDDRTVEMFAWDDDVDAYRFYKTFPDKEGFMTVEVEPAECAGCHLGAPDLMAFDATDMPMLPIMNELTEPWAHWNAEPGFKSQQFEVSDVINTTDSLWVRMNEQVGSASELEQLIRDAQKRVVSARYKKRKDEATLVSAMALMRPLFCTEQINYVSERGDSGLVGMGAFFDQNIRELLSKADYEAVSDWYYSSTLTVSFGARDDAQHLIMLPERGAADMAIEIKMARVLTPMQLLRIRALDWHNPAFSDFRCNLWKGAHDRLRQNPPSFVDSAETNADLVPKLYEEIMQVGGKSLLQNEGALVVLHDATTDNVKTLEMMLDAGDLPLAECADDKTCQCESNVCSATLTELEGIIQHRVDEVVAGGRDAVWSKRQSQICTALDTFANSPFVEEVDQCQ